MGMIDTSHDIGDHLPHRPLLATTSARPTSIRPTGASPLRFFLLFLLTDTDFELHHFGILKRLVIVPRDRIRQVLVHLGILRQDGHQGEAIVAGRAEGPEPLYIRNCHNSF